MEAWQCTWPFVPPDARQSPSTDTAREGNTSSQARSTEMAERSSRNGLGRRFTSKRRPRCAYSGAIHSWTPSWQSRFLKTLQEKAAVKRLWELVADKLTKAGWSLGWVSAIETRGRHTLHVRRILPRWSAVWQTKDSARFWKSSESQVSR
jgi:hypothetical protein